MSGRHGLLSTRDVGACVLGVAGRRATLLELAREHGGNDAEAVVRAREVVGSVADEGVVDELAFLLLVVLDASALSGVDVRELLWAAALQTTRDELGEVPVCLELPDVSLVC